MAATLRNDFRRILILFAGFMIGMHVAVLLHELGHALGYWLGGGTVRQIVMQSPLPAGRVEGSARNPFMPVWGGVAFGALMTVPALLIARSLKRHPAASFAALMAAAFCLGHNGMYLFIGSVIPFADASSMIALGTPRWLLFLLGLPLIVGFILVLASAIHRVGLSPTEPLLKWIILVELGLLTFPALMVASMFFMPVPRSVRLPTIAFVACYALCFYMVASRARAATALRLSDIEKSQMNRGWSQPAALIFAAVLLITIEWLAFGT